MRYALILTISVLFSHVSTALAADDFLWVEAESAAQKSAITHPWYNSVKKDHLSGGEWLSNFGNKPALLTYNLQIPADGKYTLWLRANSVLTSLSYKIGEANWSKIDFSKNVYDNTNIAADGKPDLRFISWVKATQLDLKQGPLTVEFKMDSANNNHGGLDCFLLTRKPFHPSGTRKPGQKTNLADPGMWAFEPDSDSFDEKSPLDLRSLNEPIAGQNGPLKLSPDGNAILLADNKPARLWSLTSFVYQNAGMDDLDYHARKLAKMGVNMTRVHTTIADTHEGAKLGDINTKERDAIFRHIAAMKKAGIYTTISPYFALTINKVPISWGIDGYTGQPGQPFGVLFYDEKLKSAYKSWLTQLLQPVNPHTGLSLAADSALGIFQIQNEDSLLFWTFANNNLPEPQRKKLQKLFGAWAIKKYSSLDKAFATWQWKTKGDDASIAEAGILGAWEMTSKAHAQVLVRGGDQMEFLCDTMRNFNLEIIDHLRTNLGFKGLINPGCWKPADTITMMDPERYTYTTGDIISNHNYVGAQHINPANAQRAGWSIDAGDLFEDMSVLKSPRNLPTNLKQVVGRANLLTESTWVGPITYRSEAPFLVAAYSSLTGVQSLYWFATGSLDWDNSLIKFPVSEPMLLGQFPAAALAYRRQLIQQGEDIIREERKIPDFWAKKRPLISEDPTFDPNRDAARAVAGDPTPVDPLAFLVGPVRVNYSKTGGQSKVRDLSKYILPDQHKVRAITNELELDYANGIATLNAPAAQGASGFLARHGPVKLSNITIDMKNEYATVLVVAMDQKPIKDSAKILIQIGTKSRMYNSRLEPANLKDGKPANRIANLGRPPFNIEKTNGTLTLHNPNLTRLTILDENAMPTRTQPLAAQQALQLPPDTLWMIAE